MASSTIDIDLVTRPEDDALLRSIPAIKERLQVNIEFGGGSRDVGLESHGWRTRPP
jgi:hypothetical protein